MPKVAERVRCLHLHLGIQPPLPGAKKNLPQTVQIINSQVSPTKGITGGLPSPQAGAAIHPLKTNIPNALAQVFGLQDASVSKSGVTVTLHPAGNIPPSLAVA